MSERDEFLKERTRSYIGKLLSLARPETEDRAALADLRSGLRGAPRDLYRMGKHVVPFLDGVRPDEEHWFYVVGALLAYHPEQVQGQSRTLGESFGGIKESSGSIEARFLALLNSRGDNLPDHLRQAVGLLAARRVPVDYFRLLQDCLAWDKDGRPIQLRWARDFYRANPTNNENAASHVPQGGTNDGSNG